MELLQHVIHYSLHIFLPAGIAWFFYREKWIRAYGFLLLTLVVDIDHLLATPVFQACRCSIGFHPLHTYPVMIVYTLGLAHPKTRIFAIGLLLHMATDYIDCLFTRYNCGA